MTSLVKHLRVARARRVSHLCSMALLMLLWLILYARHAGELGLYSDDWWHLRTAVTVPFRTLITTWPLDYRPFEMLPWIWFHAAFGQSYALYYLSYLAIVLATSLLLYLLIDRLTGRTILAFSGAALWLVYPSDLSVLWLTTIAYRLSFLFLLAGLMLLVMRPALSPARFGASVACCALCLMGNELFLGLLLLLPLVAAAVPPATGTRGRLLRATPYLMLMAAYVAYRLWLGPHVLHFFDNYAGESRLDIGNALTTHEWGLLITLLQSWQAAVTVTGQGVLASPSLTLADTNAMFSWVLTTSPGVASAYWYLLDLYVVVSVLAAITWLRRRQRAVLWEAIRPGAAMLALGLGVIVLGYLAFSLTVQRPTLVGVASRVNAASAPGGALFMVGAAWVLTHWLPLPRRVSRSLFVLSVAACLWVGYARTARTAAIYTAAWTSQQQMWRSLHAAVPDIQPHTIVLLTARDQAGADVLAPLQVWGVDSAIALQYPGQDVSGSYLRPADVRASCNALRAAERGTESARRAQVAAYARVLIVQYSAAGEGQMIVAHGGLAIAGAGCTLLSHDERILRIVGPPRIRLVR